MYRVYPDPLSRPVHTTLLLYQSAISSRIRWAKVGRKTVVIIMTTSLSHTLCSINMLIPPQKTVFELEEEEEKAMEIQRWQERRRRASLDMTRRASADLSRVK